jgi:flavin-dependent dehydrogenase
VNGVEGRIASRDRVRFGARLVVGADGVRSRVARAVGSRVLVDRPRASAVRYAYFGGIPWPGFEFHIGDRLMAGVFPTHGGEANVWVCSPSDRTEPLLDLIAEASPALASRLRDAEQTSPVRGAHDLPNHLRQPYGPGWVLVGDAGYHRDPVTGHGITDAFRDAELAARAIDQVLRGERTERPAFRHYHRLRDELIREVFEATVAMAAYPPIDEFVEHQKQVSRAIENEALFLADLDPWPTPVALAA